MSIVSKPDGKLYEAIEGMIAEQPSIRWPALAKKTLRFIGQPGADNEPGRLRALASNAAIGDTIGAVFGAALAKGFDNEPDSTAGWTTEMPAENFEESELFVPATEGRLERLARGDAVEEADTEFAKSTYRIVRFAKQIVVDEQDMVDGKPVGAVLHQFERMGVEAARLRPDLVYSVILANGAVAYDSKALFHADHGNLATAALDAASLAAGVAAIGNQNAVDVGGDPIHTNNRAAFLIVPPDLVATARSLVRDLQLTDGADLVVQQESRIGASGLVDPDSETANTGSATNWLLAGKGTTMPSVVVLALDGRFSPTSRQFNLDKSGRWGMGWDIKMDIGAKAVDHRPVYWSAGTG